MKVSIELSPEYSEPYAIIYADKITDSIQRTLDIFAAIFQIALAFIIWGGFMLHYRNDVRKMNEKIKEL